ncbi:MAG: glucoamylase family protein [Chloroflexota bacterium]
MGTYLIAEAREELALALGWREPFRHRLRQFAYRHPASIYLVSVGLLTALMALLPLAAGLQVSLRWLHVLGGLLVLGPTSELAVQLVNYLITRLLPPRTLPKMDFSSEGIPDESRTLVVVPAVLSDAETIRIEIEKLEVRYLANAERNLAFGIFSDYADAPEQHRPEDPELLARAVPGVAQVNPRYGERRCYLFHRERVWTPSEGKFIGWERKRGKLEELNRLIAGAPARSGEPQVLVGDREGLIDIRFVITLDSDTQLPRDTARRMAETLAHPLNLPRFNPDGKLLPGTYAIIQPRVSPSLPSATATPFSRTFSDPVGVDPYTKAVSDAYQDLAGAGSYHGKAIYDPRAFHRVLSDRFPEEWLLSHDLIEGEHLRVGLASDIELFDEFPADYLTYRGRQHRWIRGDWQIVDWILPKVPSHSGERVPNPLSALSRWKVFDNVRRSLVPVMSLALLLVAWLNSAAMSWAAGILIAGVLLFLPVAQPLTWATSAHGLNAFSLRQIGHDIVRAMAEASLLPHQAGLTADAILRVWYRRLVTKRGLLEWTTARMGQRASAAELPRFMLHTTAISLVAALLGLTLAIWKPTSLVPALPWIGLWVLCPLVGWWMNRRPTTRQKLQEPAEADLRMLRQVARKTWRYFDDFVGEDTHWLPPDNYQVSHQNRVALRTSPTNIGMWMLSALAACDFGYLTFDQAVDRLAKTFKTLDQLERHEGHLLNWYDLQDLQPLKPRYVSSVDSGNFVAGLWTLSQGLRGLSRAPLLPPAALAGLLDTAEVLGLALADESKVDIDRRAVAALVDQIRQSGTELGDIIRCLRNLKEPVTAFADRAREHAGTQASAAYWARQLQRQVSAWIRVIDRYLSWTETSNIEAGPIDLAVPPSLADLAGAWAPSLEGAEAGIGRQRSGVQFSESFALCRLNAQETLVAADRLVEAASRLADQVNLGFLYDPQRRLFSVGFKLSENRLDDAFYDLLASEARLGSLVAIAGGQVPVEHWLSMSRPFSSHGRHRVLLSWTGTMFEYLMPLLFQRTFSNSLLEKAAREAVELQVAYGRRRRVPWGMSESAYGDLDLNKTYQYKAFGVPWLALKRGLEDEVVVAPYATMLAIGLIPRVAIDNLKSLSEHGLLNDYGYYEAIDFTREPRREEERGVIVRAYMANHQGMSFLALDNFLNQSVMQRRFHSDPRIRAAEPLLYERIPAAPPVHYISTRERLSARPEVPGIAPSVSRYDTVHTEIPKVQLLGNGRYSLMVTGSGGGFSRWTDFDLTRWRADTTRDHWGTFCYVRDVDSDRLWSTTYQPAVGEPDEYSVRFHLDRVEFRRRDGRILTETEVVVSPEDDIEIRRITLSNRSLRPRHLELTSYIELAMAAHRADRLHPAFNKLFIQTEANEGQRSLLASRRPRDPDEPPIYMAHRITLAGDTSPFVYATDRNAFIGRGRTLRDPQGVRGELGNTAGFVLDPILSLRKTVRLAAGERVQISLVLGAAKTREAALQMMEKYADPLAIERAIELAWASSRLELRLLRILPDQALRFQQLAGHMLYPNWILRPPADRVQDNRKGQSGLWPYGISGDLPIAIVNIGEAEDIGLVRRLLQAQAHWRRRGFAADLVILNEESSSYEQPLKERLERHIEAHTLYAGADQVGNVFLLSVDQLPEEDRTLLQAAARISLVAARGSLAQQLVAPSQATDLPEALVVREIEEEPSAPLAHVELQHFNGLGGFTPDGSEYVIQLGPEAQTPAPWVNVLANPIFGTMVSESGAGFTWSGNSQRNRLTEWSNDPVLDPPTEVLYIRDEETGALWSPTANPIREAEAYRARHGAGYSVFEHNSHAIEQELTLFVPVDDQGGEPIKLSKLKLRNDSGRPRVLSVTYYVEWTLGESREDSQQDVLSQWDEEAQALLARNGYHPDYPDRVSFAALDPSPASYSADRADFLGRNGDLSAPAALKRIRLSGRVGGRHDPCAALQVRLELAPGETGEVICMLGQADTMSAAHELIAKYRESLAIDEALQQTRSWWDHLLGAVQVNTPEPGVDVLINRWLLYQCLSCRIWGRSALYQSGGAFGFRDQLQDVLALLYSEPKIARDHILLAATRQFQEGDVQHWWHPPAGAGSRSRISDDLLWLPYATAEYIRTTGDVGILQERLPFLEARLLEQQEGEAYLVPSATLQRETLFEHCRRAVERGLTSGQHGLPLMGTGDWNDGMNRVGSDLRGESVWLGWFLIEVLKGMADMAERVGEVELGAGYRQRAERLAEQIEATAWDGSWYLRAWFDDGTPIGSSMNEEARIDSLAQSWASISGAGDSVRTAQALDSAWRHLVSEQQGLALVLTPPFDRSVPSPGYIQGYPPGVRENGGQYTHAAIWLAIGLARQGDGERAVQLLRMLNPIEHSRELSDVGRYGVEPYVIAADIYRLTGQLGHGGWTWYTGSAAWMYRAWVEELLGLRLSGETLRVDPVIPPDWPGFSLRYQHGRAVYEIQVENPDGLQRGVAWVELDGRRLGDAAIPLERAAVKHRIRVRLGSAQPGQP